jgi:hypothetical protein
MLLTYPQLWQIFPWLSVLTDISAPQAEQNKASGSAAALHFGHRLTPSLLPQTLQ